MTNDFPIRSEADVAIAWQRGKRLAEETGLNDIEQTYVVTSISELANNLLFHAIRGVITMKTVSLPDRRGIEIISQDEGPGIEDINLAFKDGYSTTGGLGNGLGAVRRMMDEFEIESTPGKGTRIVARIWRKAVE